MKAFISYSLNDSEQYILTILSRKLREQGFSIVSNYKVYDNSLDFETSSQLSNSNLFIGIITKTGHSNNQVFAEWNVAIKRKIPALLLVEDSVDIAPPLKTNRNVLLFNRFRPEIAIEKIRTNISTNNQVPVNNTKQNDSTAAWILGGLAALAIVGLLAKDK
ncbi:MAG: hypothetical protein QM535_21455 [Limnohabitans sp.]|nr:hypothetical protein [Limnohabitans sp.]